MNIDEGSRQDLALDAADAENVVGGAKKKATKKPVAHQQAPANSVIVVNAPPLPVDLTDTSMETAPQGDDPDC